MMPKIQQHSQRRDIAIVLPLLSRCTFFKDLVLIIVVLVDLWLLLFGAPSATLRVPYYVMEGGPLGN